MKIQHFEEFDRVDRKTLPLRGVTKAPRRESYTLPCGAQAKMIDAALIAEQTGCPINRLMTIRTEMLKGLEIDGIFLGEHEADAIKGFLEKLRHWHRRRQIPYAHVFTREYIQSVGEHLHLGYHGAEKYDADFCRQMTAWMGEGIAPRRSRKRGEIAISENQSWQVKHCLRNGQSGVDVAIYLSKDEPSKIAGAWGDRPNNQKRVFRHTVSRGRIEGLSRHEYRCGVSRNISPTSKSGIEILATISDDDRKIGMHDKLPY